MKKACFLTAVTIILVSMISFGQTTWKEFSFEEHNFKIDFNQPPIASSDSSEFNDAPLITYYWEAENEDATQENSYYSISVVSYPSDFIHSDSVFDVVEGFINSTQYSLLDDDTFSLLTSSLTEKEGFPGKSFKWKNNSSNIFFENQVYLIENRLFQLTVIAREGYNHNIFVQGFFNSFGLLNISKGNYKIAIAYNERTLSIEFPDTPKVDTKIVDTEHGKVSLEIQSYEPTNKDDNLVYVASETKYPEKIIDKNDPYALNTLYANSINQSLSSVSGTIISIADIDYNGNPGKEFRCYYLEGKAIMVYRLFYIDETLYNFGVITLPENEKNKAMNKFFQSFQIIRQ